MNQCLLDPSKAPDALLDSDCAKCARKSRVIKFSATDQDDIVWFNSVNEAAEAENVHPATIYARCRTPRTYEGYYWYLIKRTLTCADFRKRKNFMR